MAPLETAKVSFGLLDVNNEGRIRLAELKAAVLRLGLHLNELQNAPFRLDDPNKTFLSFREWLAFAEAYPSVVSLIGQRLGGVVTRGDAASPTRRRGSRTLTDKGGGNGGCKQKKFRTCLHRSL